MATPEQINDALHAYLFNPEGYGDTLVDDKTIADWIIGVGVGYDGHPELHIWERSAVERWYEKANKLLDEIEGRQSLPDEHPDKIEDEIDWMREGEPRPGIAWAMGEVADEIFVITEE